MRDAGRRWAFEGIVSAIQRGSGNQCGGALFMVHGGDVPVFGDQGRSLNDSPYTSEVKERNVDENGRRIEGPGQFLRLMLGPDGTLWANNKNGNALFAFKPQYAEPALVSRQENLKSNMVYQAASVIAMAEGGLNLEAGKKIMLQARNGISFPRGFAVKKGAGLIYRTGF